MTDRELLELAAKAAGIKGFRYVNNEPIQGGYRTGLWSDLYEDCWNPLTDNGDALRLAVKLEMQVSIGLRRINVSFHIPSSFCSFVFDKPAAKIREENPEDPYAATRRAITRAAAEIGRNMK